MENYREMVLDGLSIIQTHTLLTLYIRIMVNINWMEEIFMIILVSLSQLNLDNFWTQIITFCQPKCTSTTIIVAQFVSKLLKLTKKCGSQQQTPDVSIVHSVTPSQTLCKEAENFHWGNINIENIIFWLNRRKNQYQWLHNVSGSNETYYIYYTCNLSIMYLHWVLAMWATTT